MKIRSITYFFNPGWPLWPAEIHHAGQFIQNARRAFTSAGYDVQTTRLATIPFPLLVPPTKTLALAQTLLDTALEAGFDYLSLGPAIPSVPESYQLIPDILARVPNVSFGGILASAQDGISLPAIKSCAEIIKRASMITADGFANFRFAALANVLPGTPFLPAAYHQGDQPTFALALEAADLAVSTISASQDVASARQNFQNIIETNAAALEKIANGLASSFRTQFAGLDFTLAPFPEIERSAATAIERLGIPATGLPGTLAAAAFITEALDRAQYRRIGFNGLMLPILEDATLAARAAEGLLSINDLLLYSTVCGTGLDTIPLPGDTTVDQLAAILLDVAALAMRLNKPLTARLLPIPGKSAGEWTEFAFGYFANTRIFDIPPVHLQGILGGRETFFLSHRSAPGRLDQTT